MRYFGDVPDYLDFIALVLLLALVGAVRDCGKVLR